MFMYKTYIEMRILKYV